MQGLQTILQNGTIIQNRYVVESLLGKGGFGAVYLVKDQRVKGNLFALKEVIDPSKQERDRFTFECEVLKRLDHRALPRVYHVFEDDSHIRAYMLMDYVEGPNLEELRLRQPEKRFSTTQAIEIMRPIFDAVIYLHKQRPPIIHRDIKPANIIVPDTGDDAMLVDFGIAKEYDKDSTTTAVRRCSPGYGAPEQYARGTDPRTDIYGLAATLYTLLTGVIPADALYRMTQLGSKHTDPLEPVRQLVPQVPVGVAEAIQRAIETSSADRYSTVEEFWQELQAGLEPTEIDEALEETGKRAVVALPITPPVASVEVIENEPTVVYRRSGVVAANKPRRRLLYLFFLLLALIALGSGIAFGSLWLPNRQSSGRAPQSTATASQSADNSVPATTAPATPTIAATTALPTTAPSPTPVATATATTSSTSTAPPAYPQLLPTYVGTLVNQYQIPNVTTSMTLERVKQSGADISGYFSVGAVLQGSGNFSGKVTTDKQVQFLVEGVMGHPPLFFEGRINSNRSMAGTYCSYVNNHCDKNAGGYGTWSVAPAVGSS